MAIPQDLPKSFVMLLRVQDACVPIPKFTTILKVISDCLILQHTVKRGIFLHTCIQTVK